MGIAFVQSAQHNSFRSSRAEVCVARTYRPKLNKQIQTSRTCATTVALHRDSQKYIQKSFQYEQSQRIQGFLPVLVGLTSNEIDS